MAGAFGLLAKEGFRHWISVRGLVLLLVAAGFPALLAGAWVVTHQADLVVVSQDWSPDPVVEQDNVTFTAVIKNEGSLAAGSFNVTLQVQNLAFDPPRVAKTEDVRVDGGLGPGESREVTLEWRATSIGVFGFLVEVDPDDEVGEIEEFNNGAGQPLFSIFRPQDESDAPEAPDNLTGTAPGASPAIIDLDVTDISWDPTEPKAESNATFTATVANNGPDTATNVTLTLEVGRVFGSTWFVDRDTTMNATLGPGESTDISLDWNNLPSGRYFVRAYANATAGHNDTVEANNHRAESVAFNPEPLDRVDPPEIPERLSIKVFYNQVLLYHFWLVVPFVALFYAGGVVADDRSKGNLSYLLTSPINRSTIPLARFLSGFVLASVAVALASLIGFLILFGFSAESDIGFLTTPMISSLVALFTYGGLFTFFGVLFNRPYVAGIIYILIWESLGMFDRLIEVTDATIQVTVADWVEDFTILFNLFSALGDWPVDQGLVWLPTTAAGAEAVRNLLIAGVVFLFLAMATMRRREFPTS